MKKEGYGHLCSDIWISGYEGHNSCIESFLYQGENINGKDSIIGWTALHRASFHGHPKTIEYLLRRGADSNVRDNEGKTAFDVAKTEECKNAFLNFKKR